MIKRTIQGLLLLSFLLLQTACGRNSTEITVLSREEGSGTRSAFTELSGLLQDGQDLTYPRAEVNASTAVMIQTVIYNPSAIGYVSLGTLSQQVKALPLDGVYPTVESLQDGSYPLSRSFLLGITGELPPLAADFLRFLRSDLAGRLMEDSGYAPMDSAPYTVTPQQGLLRLAGSSSVAPIMEKLGEEYCRLQPHVTFQLQASDSSTGLSALRAGLCDIAMSSRDLSADEQQAGIIAIPLCKDGIAVIVSPKNPVEGLNMEQLRRIFTGELRHWDQLP